MNPIFCIVACGSVICQVNQLLTQYTFFQVNGSMKRERNKERRDVTERKKKTQRERKRQKGCKSLREH